MALSNLVSECSLERDPAKHLFGFNRASPSPKGTDEQAFQEGALFRLSPIQKHMQLTLRLSIQDEVKLSGLEDPEASEKRTGRRGG